jgi:hypothetical protein
MSIRFTRDFSVLPTPDFLSSASLIAAPTRPNPSFSLSPTPLPSRPTRVPTKSSVASSPADCASSIRELESPATSAAKKTRIVERILSLSPTAEWTRTSHARVWKSVALALRAKSGEQSLVTISRALGNAGLALGYACQE